MARAFYCISRFRDSKANDKPLVMLYRFKYKNERDAYVKLSEWRVAVPLKVARAIFPKLNKHEYQSPYWTDLEMNLEVPSERGYVRVRARGQYFTDPDSGFPFTEAWYMIPNFDMDAIRLKTRYNQEEKLRAEEYEREHLHVARLLIG